ncbi:MAG: hypothetical protein M3Z35_13910, partial [Nitrospirota bacterium]|nr:hypothetical protein [Nitrospirota bacterium]
AHRSPAEKAIQRHHRSIADTIRLAGLTPTLNDERCEMNEGIEKRFPIVQRAAFIVQACF